MDGVVRICSSGRRRLSHFTSLWPRTSHVIIPNHKQAANFLGDSEEEHEKGFDKLSI